MERPSIQCWIQSIANPVTEDAHGKSREKYSNAWQHGNPPGGGQVVPAEPEHVSKTGHRRLNADAEKTQGGLQDDGTREVEGHIHD